MWRRIDNRRSKIQNSNRLQQAPRVKNLNYLKIFVGLEFGLRYIEELDSVYRGIVNGWDIEITKSI